MPTAPPPATFRCSPAAELVRRCTNREQRAALRGTLVALSNANEDTVHDHETFRRKDPQHNDAGGGSVLRSALGGVSSTKLHCTAGDVRRHASTKTVLVIHPLQQKHGHRHFVVFS